MAVIDHAFVEQNTPQTTTSTSYVDITGAAIASGSFVAGKQYLIYVTAQFAVATSNIVVSVRAMHGSTAFADSETQHRLGTIANIFQSYSWFTVWTAVTDEGIKLQMDSNGTATVTVDQVAMIAINLTDDLTENTDWFVAERATDDSLSTTPVDGASITFTPAVAANDWLVLSLAQVDVTSSSLTSTTRLDRSGEGSSSTPSAIVLCHGNVAAQIRSLNRVFTLGNASNTFKEISVASGTANTRLHSRIFALNLNKFQNHSFIYTEADASLSATDYATELASIAITPSVDSDVWIGSYWCFDKAVAGRTAKFRVQVDDADQPAGQTTDARPFLLHEGGGAEVAEEPENILTLANLDDSAHTIALDASADSTTGTPAGQHRSLWAVTMELSSGAPGGRPEFLSNDFHIGGPAFRTSNL